jgi:hypothetical protein
VEAKIQKTYDLNLSLMAIKCNRPQVSSNTPLKKLVIKLTVFSSRKKVTMLKELKTELLSTLYQIPPLEELGKSLEVQTFVPIMRHIEPQLHFFPTAFPLLLLPQFHDVSGKDPPFLALSC